MGKASKKGKGKKNKGAVGFDEGAPRTGVGEDDGEHKPRSRKRQRTALALDRDPPCEKCGQVHAGCRGHTKHGPNAGNPCGANPPTGQLLCLKHGGKNPTHQAKARERLIALVDPALAALDKVLRNPKTDDNTKVRAAVAVLDRAGFRPGVVLEVKPASPWDLMDGEIFIDRSFPEVEGPAPSGPATDQLARRARDEAWAPLDREDEPERIEPDFNTVPGEVVESQPAARPSPTSGHPIDFGDRYDAPPGATEMDGSDPSKPTKSRRELIEEALDAEPGTRKDR